MPTLARRTSKDGRQGGKKNAVCPQCEDVFTEKELGCHMRQDHAHKCNFCPLRFTYVNGRDNHENSVHTLEAVADQFKLSCLTCGLVFSRNTTYEKHAKREHSVACRERGCRRRFTNVILMESHVDLDHKSGASAERATPEFIASGSNKTSSPPVRVRNVYSGAAIVDSPGKSSHAPVVPASRRTLDREIEATKAKLSSLFNIKVSHISHQ